MYRLSSLESVEGGKGDGSGLCPELCRDYFCFKMDSSGEDERFELIPCDREKLDERSPRHAGREGVVLDEVAHVNVSTCRPAEIM